MYSKVWAGHAEDTEIIVVASMALLFGVLLLFMEATFVIIASAFIGSFGVVRGIAFFAGFFPDEASIDKVGGGGECVTA